MNRDDMRRKGFIDILMFGMLINTVVNTYTYIYVYTNTHTHIYWNP